MIKHTTDTILIFSDAAVSAKKNMAVGAFLYLDPDQLKKYNLYSSTELTESINNQIIYQIYESHQSTWSEIMTVINAITHLQKKWTFIQKLEVYTDCQSLFDLLGRRKEQLQKNNFITRNGNIHHNAELYKTLYKTAEPFQISIFKIIGHQPSSQNLTIHEKIFAIVDKLCRKKLRHLISE